MAKALDLQQRAQSLVTEATGKLSPIHFLKVEVAAMSREDVDALAVAYLYGQVKGRKRRATLTVERHAERPSGIRPKAGTKAFAAWAEVPANAEVLHDEDWAEEQRLAAFTARIGGLIREHNALMRVEWTRELLESKFALGDGASVRWGEATREQHESRVEMHRRNALAGIEGAARHQQAIDELDATGCLTLADAVMVAT